jgi:sugar O-acyltransferase (sialic acid O-acetyltransferase NeuD family)
VDVGRGLVIVGTGGMGREAAAWVADAGRADDLLGFVDDDPAAAGTEVAGFRVLGPLAWATERTDVEVVVAIGTPAVRAAVVARLDAAGVPLASVAHPSAVIGPRVALEPGVIVCPGAVLTCDIQVGRAAIVNYGALVGHDGVLGACCFVAPGVHLAGTVTVGPRADVGIGASVIQGVTIGADAVIGAGAVVIRDVAEGETVVGVPARPIHRSAP